MVSVEPMSCLQDEPVTIRVCGLLPNQRVTLMSHLKDTRNVNFISLAHFVYVYQTFFSSSMKVGLYKVMFSSSPIILFIYLFFCHATLAGTLLCTMYAMSLIEHNQKFILIFPEPMNKELWM